MLNIVSLNNTENVKLFHLISKFIKENDMNLKYFSGISTYKVISIIDKTDGSENCYLLTRY